MSEFEFTIFRLPPSAHKLFYTSKRDYRTHKSRVFTDWLILESRSFWMRRGKAAIQPPVGLRIEAVVNSRRHLETLVTPTIELLLHNRVIADNANINHIELNRITAEIPPEAATLGMCHVRVWQFAPPEAAVDTWLSKMRSAFQATSS